MYKVTIEEVLGEIKKITIIETDDVELVRELLDLKHVKEIDSDEPNRNISEEWQKLCQEQLEKMRKDVEPFTQPFKIKPLPQPYVSPFTKPYDPYNPFTVTC